MIKTALLLCAFMGSVLLRAEGAEFSVSNVAELQKAVKAARPGDAIILREGEWPDAEIVLRAKGTAEAPITVKAAVPGRTVFTGKARLRVGGEHLVLEGFHFRDPDPAAGDVIELRANSREPARNCRVTQCAITLAAGAVTKEAPETRWLNLYGSGHRVDHCTIQGKANAGTTVVVWLGPGNEGGHRLEANYFGPREPLGRNGGETIRVGDSANSRQTAACIVEGNFFEKCNGELECISNKSCGNVYRGNTFAAVSGTLTLRHGNGCLVEGNVFRGEKARGTGGLRIIGEDHVVRGNYLEGLTGTDARAAICLMLGVPDSPLNGYFQVRRARVEENTLVNCSTPIVIGLSDHAKASLAPEETVFARNEIVAPKRTVIEARCSPAGIRWEGNVFFGKELGMQPTNGIEWRETRPQAIAAVEREATGAEWFEKGR